MNFPTWAKDRRIDDRVLCQQLYDALKIAMEALDMTTGFCVDFRLNQKDWKDHPDVATLFAYIDSQKRRISELGK